MSVDSFTVMLVCLIALIALATAVAFGMYWLVRLAVRHGNQDKGRHA